MIFPLQQSYSAHRWAKCLRTSFPFRFPVVSRHTRRSERST